MSTAENDPELNALEAALGELSPAGATFRRDELFFRAGQAAARPRRWVWPALTAGFAVLVIGLGTERLLMPLAGGPERIVYVPLPPVLAESHESPSTATQKDERDENGKIEPLLAGATGYLQREREMLRWGADALPDPPVVPAFVENKPLTRDSLLELVPESKERFSLKRFF